MTTATLSTNDVVRAKQIWAEYQKQHDVTARKGQAVGIDPASGRIWFGDSALDIRKQMDAEGVGQPLLVLRVGYDYYLRKGGRR
jgi:hypothetical protein